MEPACFLSSLEWEHVAQWIGRWTQDQNVWVQFPVLAMCRSVGQTSYSTLPWSTQQ